MVLLDLMMSGMSGFEVCARLRADARLAIVPVVVVTALDDVETRLRALEAGVDEVLTKPLEAAEVRVRLRTLLRLNRLKRLLDAEARFASFAALSPDGLLVVDRGGAVAFANDAARRMLGTGKTTLAGRPVDALVDAARARELAALMAHVHAPGAGGTARLETELERASGPLPVEVIAGPVAWDGRPAAQLLLRDVTERKRLERELLHRERLALMGTLLAGVAHDLGNPLAAAHLQAQLIEQDGGDPALASRAARIRALVDRCVRVLRSFLVLASRRPAERSAVDVNAVLLEALEILGSRLHVAQIDVGTDLAAGLPPVMADRQALTQVALNLLDNAVDALRGCPAGRRIRVETRLDEDAEGAWVHLEVSDSGPGMPAAMLPQIFEPFETTKPVGEGTGLGLAICRTIVAAHGGEITGVNLPEGGAVFRVRLPVASRNGGAVAPTPG